MKIPKGYSEQQVLDIIDNVVNRLARKFRFGHYDVDDLKQEGRCEALEVLASNKYDETRPLENFLYTHIRNRYINLQRNKFSRREIPCKTCPFYDPENLKSTNCNQCAVFVDKMECEKWSSWEYRNAAKRNIMAPIDIDNVRDESESNMRDEALLDESASYKELLQLIDKKLPVSLRADYLRLIAKEPIPKYRSDKVRKAILEIIKYDPTNKDE